MGTNGFVFHVSVFHINFHIYPNLWSDTILLNKLMLEKVILHHYKTQNENLERLRSSGLTGNF